jgi:hypothetical protein
MRDASIETGQAALHGVQGEKPVLLSARPNLGAAQTCLFRSIRSEPRSAFLDITPTGLIMEIG